MVKPQSIRHPAERMNALAPAAMRAQPLVTRASAMGREAKQRLLGSWQWQSVRLIVIGFCGSRCVACGSSRQLECDHISPVAGMSLDDRVLDPGGLQALCRPCHQAKTEGLDADYMRRGAATNAQRDKRSPEIRELLSTSGRAAAADDEVEEEAPRKLASAEF